jgi:inosose dehydratase
MAAIRIGCVPITWKNVPQDQVLSEIAEAGYEGCPVRPMEGESTDAMLERVAGYGLKPGPGYFEGHFWKKDQEEAILERARRQAAFTRETGCTELYVAMGGFRAYTTRRGLTRDAVAGHVQPEDAMSGEEFAQAASVLSRMGEITLAEGVSSCVHNHAGTVIETPAEIDRLFSLVNRDVVFMGPDTGHLAWGGADVVPFLRKYADLIKTVHLKDIKREVLEEGRAKEWTYGEFKDHGIFTELGQGTVDIPGLLALLKEAGFEGWVLVETDVTQLPTALESAILSRQYLRTLGL